ncbi:hypothetical protein HKCCE4037_05910 [Rhodobacterales bacterium HKCCE4037]|nr:hypothetical protein [Rhodobacterales bacterium HKCCE4037]
MREATADDHLETERLFECFLTAPDDRMGWFLAAQRAAMGALAAAVPNSGEPNASADGLLTSAHVLSDLIARLDRDLARQNRQAIPLPMSTEGELDHTLHPMAVDYVVLGSRLGNEMIRRTVLADRLTGPLPDYFQAAPQADLWRYLCTSLDRLDPHSDEAQDVIQDAKSAFRIVSDAARLQKV